MTALLRFSSTPQKNLTELRFGSLVVFYSYQMPIGFMEGSKMTVRDVSHTTTQTRTHANQIEPNISVRITEAEFVDRLNAAVLRACAEIAKLAK